MVEIDLEMRTPPTGDRGCYSCRRENDGDHASTQLTSCTFRLAADDFKPGSHLEEGGLVKRRICPSTRLEGTPVTSRVEPERESSVDPRNGSETLACASGMSEYPAPSIGPRDISRAGMGGSSCDF